MVLPQRTLIFAAAAALPRAEGRHARLPRAPPRATLMLHVQVSLATITTPTHWVILARQGRTSAGASSHPHPHHHHLLCGRCRRHHQAHHHKISALPRGVVAPLLLPAPRETAMVLPALRGTAMVAPLRETAMVVAMSMATVATLPAMAMVATLPGDSHLLPIRPTL